MRLTYVLMLASVIRSRLAIEPLGSPSGLQDASRNFLPHAMANSMTAVKPLAHALPAGLIFALLCVYALATLTAASWALTRRDA